MSNTLVTKSDLKCRLGKGWGSEIAGVLGISRQAVYDWPEEIPRLRVYELRERRPDLFLAVAQPSAPDEAVPA